MSQTFRALALQRALTQVGVKEDPPDSNDGPRVREYQAVTGAYHAAWCASFVDWNYVPWVPGLFEHSAFVPFIVSYAREHGWAIPASEVEPGDLAAYDWQGDGVADHIGIVKTAPAGGSFTAVEGNTAVGNDSNGGEVMVRTRYVSNVQAFIRVPGSVNVPVPKPKPVVPPKPAPIPKEPVKYYTFKKQVPLQPGQTIGYVEKRGYYASPTYYTYEKNVPAKTGQTVKFRPGAGYYTG